MNWAGGADRARNPREFQCLLDREIRPLLEINGDGRVVLGECVQTRIL